MSEANSKNLIETFKHHAFRFSELPIEAVEADANQPRKTFGLRVGGDHNKLLKSIQCYGIEDPIKVSEISDGRFIIMDGHRRFACAQQLKFKTVPCRVYPKMQEGEFEARRYEMQNNRRAWKPIEKANAIHRIKSEFKNATPKEIADLIGMNQTSVGHYIELRDLRLDYLELMSEYNLKDFQRVRFLMLMPKLRRIQGFQVDDVVKILFDKINNRLLYKINDFQILSRIFGNASLNEVHIAQFLADSHMSVSELSELTLLSGFSVQIRNVIRELTLKQNMDIKLTEQEHTVFNDLKMLMATYI